MKILMENNQEVVIECYSDKDNKMLRAKVMSDTFGRLTFKNLN